jgi:hypothetical protein
LGCITGKKEIMGTFARLGKAVGTGAVKGRAKSAIEAATDGKSWECIEIKRGEAFTCICGGQGSAKQFVLVNVKKRTEIVVVGERCLTYIKSEVDSKGNKRPYAPHEADKAAKV